MHTLYVCMQCHRCSLPSAPVLNHWCPAGRMMLCDRGQASPGCRWMLIGTTATHLALKTTTHPHTSATTTTTTTTQTTTSCHSSSGQRSAHPWNWCGRRARPSSNSRHLLGLARRAWPHPPPPRPPQHQHHHHHHHHHLGLSLHLEVVVSSLHNLAHPRPWTRRYILCAASIVAHVQICG
jgi:hypothetical protein